MHLKEYRLTNHFAVLAPDNCCLFCDHCTDVWWDYENGPYMFFCVVDKDTSKGARGACEYFLEEET